MSQAGQQVQDEAHGKCLLDLAVRSLVRRAPGNGGDGGPGWGAGGRKRCAEAGDGRAEVVECAVEGGLCFNGVLLGFMRRGSPGAGGKGLKLRRREVGAKARI